MLRRFHFLFVALLIGCVGTPVPQPPNVDPVDPSRLMVPTEEASGIAVRGLPGAAVPASEVWAFNLEDASAPAVAEVRSDGSFELGLPVTSNEEIRLQARTGVDRSEPIDVFLTSRTVTLASRPDCLAVPKDIDLGTARTAVVSVENRCGASLEFRSYSLRAGFPEFIVTGPSMASLPDGARIELSIRATGSASVEDILFLNLEIGGSSHRYPVGVVARPPP